MSRKELTRRVAKREGRTKQVDIAQISEVLMHALDEMAELPAYELAALLKKRRTRK